MLKSDIAAKMIEVIKEDATGTMTLIFRYMDEDRPPEYCVLGGLGKAMGLSDAELESSVESGAYNKIEKYYGLDFYIRPPESMLGYYDPQYTMSFIDVLWRTNDDRKYETVEQRREALIALVREYTES